MEELKLVQIGAPMTVSAARALLEHAVVNFEYVKLDGSVREATGSRNLDLLARQGVSVTYPKGTGRPNYNCYWDLSRREWRSWSDIDNNTINVISWSRDKSDVFIPKNSQLPKSSEPAPLSTHKVV